MDIAVIAVGGVVFRLVENAFGGIIEVAVKLQQIALAGRDGAEERVSATATRDLLDKGPALVLIHFFEYSVEVGRDGAVVEELGQQRDSSGDAVRRLEVALEVKIETIFSEGVDQVVH